MIFGVRKRGAVKQEKIVLMFDDVVSVYDTAGVEIAKKI